MSVTTQSDVLHDDESRDVRSLSRIPDGLSMTRRRRLTVRAKPERGIVNSLARSVRACTGGPCRVSTAPGAVRVTWKVTSGVEVTVVRLCPVWSGGIPASGAVRCPVSGDVRGPVSGDVRGPVSGDARCPVCVRVRVR